MEGVGEMRGQRWEECFCGQEPICNDCEKCKKHCTCGKQPIPQKIDTSCPEPYRRGIGMGFGTTEDGDG